jgi:signal transduction histidine kinase
MPVPPVKAVLTRYLRAGASRSRVSLLEANAALVRDRDEAVEAHRTKSAFVASLSHQLRTPLSSILMGSELLAEDLKDQGLDALAGDVARIHDAGRLLMAMLDDVIDLTRLEAGRMVFSRVETDLAALTAKLVAVCRPLALGQGNTLEVTGDAVQATLCTDPDKLGQILFHFVNNALKFTRAGTVTLDVRSEGSDTRFTVSDTGIGMSADHVARLQLDFTQTPDARPRSYGNAGLGLTLCRVLAQGLGGSLQVASPAEGGTAFTLRLPG